MIKYVETRSRIAFVLCVAFAVRLLVFMAFRPWLDSTVDGDILIGDAIGYQRLALGLAESWSFAGETFRTPGYPFFVAIIYSVFGVKIWLVLFLQILLDLVSVYIIAEVGRLLFSRKAGLIAAVLYAIDPVAIFCTLTLNSETLFILLLVAAVYLFLDGSLNRKHGSLIFSGVLIASATLVRPLAQYYALIMCIFALVWHLDWRPNWRQSMRGLSAAGILVGAFALTSAPWVLRNYVLYDAVKLSTVQGENLLFWQVTYARVWQSKKPSQEVTSDFARMAQQAGYTKDGNPFENEKIAQRIAMEYIAANPAVYFSRWGAGISHTIFGLNTAGFVKVLGFEPKELPKGALFAADSNSGLIALFFQTKSALDISVGVLTGGLLILVYVSTLGGLILLGWQRRVMVLSFLLVSMCYFVIAGGVIGNARFRLPASPFYFVVAASFIAQLMNWLRVRGWTVSK